MLSVTNNILNAEFRMRKRPTVTVQVLFQTTPKLASVRSKDSFDGRLENFDCYCVSLILDYLSVIDNEDVMTQYNRIFLLRCMDLGVGWPWGAVYHQRK